MGVNKKCIVYGVAACFVVLCIVQQVKSHTSQTRYYRSTSADGVERLVEIIPSSVTVRPRPRQRISSAFAKQYWTTGNFFNRDNLAVNEASDEGPVMSASFQRPLTYRAKMVPIIAETIQEL